MCKILTGKHISSVPSPKLLTFLNVHVLSSSVTTHKARQFLRLQDRACEEQGGNLGIIVRNAHMEPHDPSGVPVNSSVNGKSVGL